MTHATRAVRPDPKRIAGYALAFGFNALLLMVLVAPLQGGIDWPGPADEGPRIIWYEAEPVPVVPPVPPTPVEQPGPRLPQPEAVLPRTPVAPVADPAPVLVAEGSEPAPPVVAPIAGPVADMGPPAGPMAGVRLEYLHAPAPDYPRAAVRARIEGTVLLEVLVGTDGRPLDVLVRESSGNRRLDAAARDQVLQHWRFRPALRNGRAVQAIGLVPVDFRLR